MGVEAARDRSTSAEGLAYVQRAVALHRASRDAIAQLAAILTPDQAQRLHRALMAPHDETAVDPTLLGPVLEPSAAARAGFTAFDRNPILMWERSPP
jgi:hypothetical protein